MIGSALLLAMLSGTPGYAPQGMCFERNWGEIEHMHRDLGEGRVLWVWSWNAEGVSDVVHIAECAQGQGIAATVRSERMRKEIPFDRRSKAAQVIDRALRAPHFFRLDTLSDELDTIRVPSQISALEQEPCACAAYYPGLFGSDKTKRDE